MFFEGFIVCVREVATEVGASAFFSGQSGLGDEEADGQHVLEFPAGGRVEGLVHNITLPEANLVDGLPHFGRFSGDTHVSPHNRPQGVSNI